MVISLLKKLKKKVVNLKRSGEAAHGDVRRLTTCHIEVGATHFSWETVSFIIISRDILYVYMFTVMVFLSKV